MVPEPVLLMLAMLAMPLVPMLVGMLVWMLAGSNGDSLREGDSLRDSRGWEDIFRNGSVVVC